MSEKNNNFIYKILSVDDFKEFNSEDIFYGTETDIKDGYIHSSMETQIFPILNYYYKDQSVYILKINLDELPKENVKWEFSQTWNQLFPHLYNCPIKTDYVKSVQFLKKIW